MARIPQTEIELRISAIVDAHFSLIVDGKTGLPVTNWGECASTGFECS